MVEITNGSLYMSVPRGAYKSYFEKQGFREIQNNTAKEVEVEQHIGTKDAIEDALLSKPLGQWTKDEVKKYAAEHGVDITNTKNIGEAKQRIKAFLDNAE